MENVSGAIYVTGCQTTNIGVTKTKIDMLNAMWTVLIKMMKFQEMPNLSAVCFSSSLPSW